MKGVFVTATDTGAGKTVVSCALISALRRTGLRVAGMKPVASGCEQTAAGLISDDARQLADASGLGLPMDLVNSYRFLPAIAPHVAAAEAGTRIELPRIKAVFLQLCAFADVVVVEGIGGLRVPLNDREEVADLVQMLGLPVVLVVGMRLGCLNHALLTAEAVERREIPVCGWVANHIDPDMAHQEENVMALGDRLGWPSVGRIPFLTDTSVDHVAKHLDRDQILRALDDAARARPPGPESHA